MKIANMGFLLTAMASSLGSENKSKRNYDPPKTKEELELERIKYQKGLIEIKKANGLKEFDFNGVKIWALNEKSANKKYKKITNENITLILKKSTI